MTIEEAVEVLHELDGQLYETQTVALKMAIKALEQVPKLQNRCAVLTHGQLCVFCPYECEHKAESEG